MLWEWSRNIYDWVSWKWLGWMFTPVSYGYKSDLWCQKDTYHGIKRQSKTNVIYLPQPTISGHPQRAPLHDDVITGCLDMKWTCIEIWIIWTPINLVVLKVWFSLFRAKDREGNLWWPTCEYVVLTVTSLTLLVPFVMNHCSPCIVTEFCGAEYNFFSGKYNWRWTIAMTTRKKLLSDSDIVSGINKTYRRESIAEYLTSRRGSLSDLVSSTHRKLSRDSLLGNARMSRNSSVSHQGCQGKDSKQRSNSLAASPSVHSSQSSLRESRLDHRSSTNLISGSFVNRPFLKTKSLNSIQTVAERNEESKRNSKTLANKRRRWMRKIQSIKVFDSVLKGRQNRRRFEVNL